LPWRIQHLHFPQKASKRLDKVENNIEIIELYAVWGTGFAAMPLRIRIPPPRPFVRDEEARPGKPAAGFGVSVATARSTPGYRLSICAKIAFSEVTPGSVEVSSIVQILSRCSAIDHTAASPSPRSIASASGPIR
jgi:hypothetical protein